MKEKINPSFAMLLAEEKFKEVPASDLFYTQLVWKTASRKVSVGEMLGQKSIIWIITNHWGSAERTYEFFGKSNTELLSYQRAAQPIA